MKFTPKGIVIPVITPVTADGTFKEAEYRRLLNYFIDHGVHGVFPFGTTGEFYAFDNGFFRHVLEVTMDEVKGRMDVYAGANHITPKGAIELAKIAEEVKVDALSVLTPMFVSQTQQEVYEYYKEIAAETSLPIIIYNNRPKTNVTVEPATVAKLAEIDNIIGVKDSTGDFTNTEEYLRLTRGTGFHVMLGRDTLILAGLHYGASGAIASCANVAPRVAADIYEKFMAGDYAGALEAQYTFSSLRIATNMGTFPVVLKEALKMIGHDCGDCVKPIQPLSDAQRAKLREVLAGMKLL